MTEIFQIAKSYRDAGLSLLPIRADGSKAPLIPSWLEYQKRIPTDEELQQWFGNGQPCGIGIIGGQVSGNLEILDFESGSPIQEFRRSLTDLDRLDLVKSLTAVCTPSEGLHLYYRCSDIARNQKILVSGRKTVVETRAEGGYCLAPGSPAECHPTGKVYQLAHGSLAGIQTITPEDRGLLFDVIRSLGEPAPVRIQTGLPSVPATGEGTRPGDDFNQRATWESILEPAGWKYIYSRDEEDYWCRPGKKVGVSATSNYKGSGLFYVFSSNASPFEPETSYSKFAVYAILTHGGDFQAAGKELRSRGYGKEEPIRIDEWKARETGQPIKEISRPEENGNAAPVLPSVSEVVSVLSPLSETTSGEELDGILRKFSQAAGGSDSIRRATIRTEALKALKEKGFQGSTRLIDAALGLAEKPEEGKEEGRRFSCEDREPWPEPVDGREIFNEIKTLLLDFLVLPKSADTGMALWTIFTYCTEGQETAPILTVNSATKRCGKTRLLEALNGIVNRPLVTSSITASALFRSIDRFQPTLLCDEFDAGGQGSNEDLRCIINAGWRRNTANVLRSVGDDNEPRMFCCFGPKVLAAIGNLPETIADRSIVIAMKRKTRQEKVKRLIYKKFLPLASVLASKIQRWVDDHAESILRYDAEPPEKLNDRQADNWLPLLAIAHEIGPECLQEAIEAALTLSGEDLDEQSYDILLLEDIRKLFQEEGGDRIPTATLLEKLKDLEDRPWADYRNGKSISSHNLSKILSKFDVKPQTIKLNGKASKGYLLEKFQDAFERYLSDRKPEEEENKKNGVIFGGSIRNSVTTLSDKGFEAKINPLPAGDGYGSKNGSNPCESSKVTELRIEGVKMGVKNKIQQKTVTLASGTTGTDIPTEFI